MYVCMYIASGLQRLDQWAKALQLNQVLCLNPTKGSVRLRNPTLGTLLVTLRSKNDKN